MTAYHVLHLVLMDLKATAGPSQREQLISGWAALAMIPGVLHLGVVPQADTGSSYTLAFFGLFRDAPAVEAFGTDTRHMAFLQSYFLPALQGFAASDLFVPQLPPQVYESALCLLYNPNENAYEWQIRAVFDALYQDSKAVALIAGTAINAKQRYRAGGILFFATADAAGTYAHSDQLQRLRAQHRQTLPEDLTLLWGAARVLSVRHDKEGLP